MAKKRAWWKKKAESPAVGVPGGPGWEPVPGVRLRLTLRGHTSYVYRIAWSPDGRWLASPSNDTTIRIWDTVTGDVVRTLKEHTGAVISVAWSPDGRRLASAADDQSVRLWDAETGQAQQTLEGHTGNVKSVAWSPDGRRLASASSDKMVRLWDAETGQALQTLKGHTKPVSSVAWSPNGRRLASAADDQSVRLWDAETGRALWTVDGHATFVNSVVWWPESAVQRVASASYDKTVRIWEAETGQATNVLEGHTGFVACAAISPDAKLIASKGGSEDNTVRLWRCDTWQPVAIIPEPASDNWPPGVAFHPHEPLLATVGSDPGTEKEGEGDRLIHIWELDYAVLLGEDRSRTRESSDPKSSGVGSLTTSATTDSVLHATAKIVLVGDSGVGKTGLGWRLAHGEFKEHASTHGQQFWVLDQLNAQRKDDTQCEAVLWDLAGQPDYRLIHALHIADADLAVILFDPTHARDPLGSVHYWLGQLPSACPKILVPARIDRGSPTLTTDELDQFCRQQKITGGFVETSASKGVGLDELLERMKDQIPWDQKTAVTTTATFKRIKDFVLSLKEDRDGRQLIVTPAELRAMLESRRPDQAKRRSGDHEDGNDPNNSNYDEPATTAGAALRSIRPTDPPTFTDAQMLTAVERVASHGYVRMLNTSDNQTRILLVPELLNNLAASFILEARRNPKGLGAIEEQRILDDGYDFPELDGLNKSDHDLLIDATISAFVENRLSYRCFREHADETRLLVFPELMNLKKPLTDDGPLIDDLSYSVSGATENIYAALVVTLGYTNTFQRSDQWHNQARYEFAPDLICGFRRQEDEDGETSYTLFYSQGLGAPVKSLFQGLFESLLARKADQHQLIKVLRFAPVTCSECSTAVDRSQMRQRLADGKDFSSPAATTGMAATSHTTKIKTRRYATSSSAC
jgi:WD40 repeat protein/GTPase SAR1 family protein